LNHQHW